MNLRNPKIKDIDSKTLAIAREHFERIEQVRAQLRQTFDSLGPRLPADPGKAEALRKLFLDRLESSHEFELDAEGNIAFYKNNRLVDDPHGYALSASEVISDLAGETFDLGVAAPAQGASTAKGTGSTKAPAPGRKMTEDEYVTKFEAAKTQEERQALVDAWQVQEGYPQAL